jgi:hypothetical protein
MARSVTDDERAEVFSISLPRNYIAYLKEVARIESIKSGKTLTFQELIRLTMQGKYPMSVDETQRKTDLEALEDSAIERMLKRRKQGAKKTVRITDLANDNEEEDSEESAADTSDVEDESEDEE